MAIEIYIVKTQHGEDGGKRESLGLSFSSIHNAATKQEAEGKELSWILSIDEYGHTYINHYQATQLVNEIKSLELDKDQKSETDKIIAALEGLGSEQMLYFNGD